MPSLVLPSTVRVIKHPVLASLCLATRTCRDFGPTYAGIVHRIGRMLVPAATEDFPTRELTVDRGDLGQYSGRYLDQSAAIVPILRAGMGLAPAFAEVFSDSPTWHLGIRRLPDLMPELYLSKLPRYPKAIGTVFVLDPMLATGGSAALAINLVKALKPRRVVFVAVLGCAQGASRIYEEHPDVPIILPEISPGLDHRGYLLGGPGDMGDNIYGTTHE